MREPKQARSRAKVTLILEATIRLIERDGPDALTTNAIAASAGVSIGTLYQFFPNREAILDTLAAKETDGISKRVVQVMHDPALTTTEQRMTAIIRAVTTAYGARYAAHCFLLERSLTRGDGHLAPLLGRVTTHLTCERSQGQLRAAIPQADAFVALHALLGVLRAITIEGEKAPPPDDTAEALARLMVGFISSAAPAV